ncbi:hypothetical protein EDB87DRAFT_1680228 [Lactarius vividus]|nr:hypothetical protein EDB87DRAFT_1680228 [Lactarius vividus]
MSEETMWCLFIIKLSLDQLLLILLPRPERLSDPASTHRDEDKYESEEEDNNNNNGEDEIEDEDKEVDKIEDNSDDNNNRKEDDADEDEIKDMGYKFESPAPPSIEPSPIVNSAATPPTFSTAQPSVPAAFPIPLSTTIPLATADSLATAGSLAATVPSSPTPAVDHPVLMYR